MVTEVSKVIDFTEHKRSADHVLCRSCQHDKTCLAVCIAIETLVQISKVKSPLEKIEYMYNVSTHLDLENSFTADDL